MMFVMGFALTGVAAMNLTQTQNKVAFMATNKVQADALARSGFDVFYDQIRAEMEASGNYPFALDPTNLTTTVNGHNVNLGSYEATILECQKTQNDLDQGGSKIRRTTYTFKIKCKGTASNGTYSEFKVRFNAYRDQNLVKQTTSHMPQVSGQIYFPVGAIVSNTSVDIATNNGLRTYDTLGQNRAHILANDGISWSSPGKSSNTNPNVLDIQGQYLVPQGGSYDRTVSPTGIGNSNGAKNYKNPALAASGSFLGSPSDSVLKMGGPAGFADYAKTEEWRTRWYNTATGTGSTAYTGFTPANGITYNGVDRVLRCPAIINGDINVNNGELLRLMPKSTNPWDNVIYVTGDVKNKGQLLNLGVTLVVLGKYSDGPSAEYKLDTQGSPFTNAATVMQRSSLMCLNQSADAVSFSTNSSATTGLIYALRGGIDVTSSNAEFTGMLVSGGTGTDGGVKIHPGGYNSFVVKFDPNAATGGDLDLDPNSVIDVTYIPSGIAVAFAPSRPYAWAKVH